MTKKHLILVLILCLLGGGLYWFFSAQRTAQQPKQFSTDLLSPSPTPMTKTAQFAIYTQGTKRVFSDKKYHNRAKNVFIEAGDPSIVFVTQPDVTWGDFFATLPPPMQVKTDCLTTGTGQAFCNEGNNTLQFYINGNEAPDALTTEIKDGDALLVTYGNPTPQELRNQLQSLQK